MSTFDTENVKSVDLLPLRGTEILPDRDHLAL